jgi:hypothetical protein
MIGPCGNPAMSRTTTAMFFEPFIHGADAMLRRVERLVGVTPATGADAAAPPRAWMLVNLPGVAEQIAASYEAEAEARSVRLLVDLAPDALVIGDSTDLHRMVDHLVASALEGAPDGGWHIISGMVLDGVVTLTFRSSGAGRAAPTFQSPSICASAVGQILRAHDGRMEMSESSENGSRYLVRLPVAHRHLS